MKWLTHWSKCAYLLTMWNCCTENILCPLGLWYDTKQTRQRRQTVLTDLADFVVVWGIWPPSNEIDGISVVLAIQHHMSGESGRSRSHSNWSNCLNLSWVTQWPPQRNRHLLNQGWPYTTNEIDGLYVLAVRCFITHNRRRDHCFNSWPGSRPWDELLICSDPTPWPQLADINITLHAVLTDAFDFSSPGCHFKCIFAEDKSTVSSLHGCQRFWAPWNHEIWGPNPDQSYYILHFSRPLFLRGLWNQPNCPLLLVHCT